MAYVVLVLFVFSDHSQVNYLGSVWLANTEFLATNISRKTRRREGDSVQSQPCGLLSIYLFTVCVNALHMHMCMWVHWQWPEDNLWEGIGSLIPSGSQESDSGCQA